MRCSNREWSDAPPEINSRIADFRSDTVTRPSRRMYEAMLTAELGDDWFGEDPTVARLEAESARLTGKEAALLCPSGTMANQIAVRVHCPVGQEVIVEEDSHIFNHEMGALAYSMVQVRPIRGQRGAMNPEELAARVHQADMLRPGTGLVCLENPHNLAGGAIIPQEDIIAASRVAHDHGVPVHLDGARLFNAQVATGIPASELSAPADSVMFCLSKGLGAPIGSMLCGSEAFIGKARTVRKFMGGTMRQAGIIAACGLEALEPGNINALANDHRRAGELARSLAGLPYMALVDPKVETNMFYLAIGKDAPFHTRDLVARAGKVDIRLGNSGGNHIRIVCHRDIDDDAIERVFSFFTRVFRNREQKGISSQMCRPRH
uniref:L-threonine aldolase n=1 Tax=Candidatus Kentrum sp. FW TaxID=2126338 RepID=A0A450T625_9GAMM|nr:MAG: L-threonine aldolase [Candidatus Kentron sp. FW]